MSTESRATHGVYVEGNHDLYVLAEVLNWSFPEPKPSWLPRKALIAAESDEQAIASFVLAAKGRGKWGVVLDADTSAQLRWEALARALRRKLGATVEIPASPPRDGWVWEQGELRLGAWIMPDNVSAGALEAFLAPLVARTAPFAFAKSAAAEALKSHGATYAAAAAGKAELHTYLAWCEEPGPGSSHQAR